MGGYPRRRSALGLAWFIITKPARSTNCPGALRRRPYWRGMLISFAGRFLQADPEKLPHPGRQIEGGNFAGHVDHAEANQGMGSQ
jgi:hypothetical protein